MYSTFPFVLCFVRQGSLAHVCVCVCVIVAIPHKHYKCASIVDVSFEKLWEIENRWVIEVTLEHRDFVLCLYIYVYKLMYEAP